jgi:hypothetical protein
MAASNSSHSAIEPTCDKNRVQNTADSLFTLVLKTLVRNVDRRVARIASDQGFPLRNGAHLRSDGNSFSRVGKTNDLP